jgi:hypothetical protein
MVRIISSSIKPAGNYNHSGKKKYRRVYKTFFIFCFTISLALFISLIYNSYKYSILPNNTDDIPIIRADITPVKIPPADPGGTQFSNQDKLIYSSLEDKNLDINKENSEEVKEIKDVYNDVSDIRVPPVRANIKASVTNEKKAAPRIKNNEVKQKPEDKNNRKIKNNPFDLLENDY